MATAGPSPSSGIGGQEGQERAVDAGQGRRRLRLPQNGTVMRRSCRSRWCPAREAWGSGDLQDTNSAVIDVGAPRCDSHRHSPWASGSWLLRKEVIQPHLPVRLPCYDFTPIANPTFDGSLPKVGPPASGVADFRGVTGGVYKARERIHRSNADLRLLATPTSRSRVADCDPN